MYLGGQHSGLLGVQQRVVEIEYEPELALLQQRGLCARVLLQEVLCVDVNPTKIPQLDMRRRLLAQACKWAPWQWPGVLRSRRAAQNVQCTHPIGTTSARVAHRGARMRVPAAAPL
jgi:hypothetical protein